MLSLVQLYTILVLACLLLLGSSAQIRINNLLKGILSLLLYIIVVSIIIETGKKSASIFFIITICIANMAFTPGCFLYQRNLTYNNYLTNKDFIHLTPLIIFCLGCLLTYFYAGRLDFLVYHSNELVIKGEGKQSALLYFRIYLICVNTFYLFLMIRTLKKSFQRHFLKASFFSRENGTRKIDESFAPSFAEKKLAETDATLRNYFEEKKPYLLHGYSLRQLSLDIHISLPQLSAFINQHYQMHFTDLINIYRVNYCKKKIKNGEWKYKKLETIAGESGFNNRNTFTSAFKKVTGMNPSKYLKDIKEEWTPKDRKFL